MNAFASLKPSRSETKSSIVDNAFPLEPCGADAFGAPSKKNATGTCRIWEICCNRLAPMRLAALSYFCTCWKERPSAAPSFSWLIASILRRIRTRLPTCWSMGFGTAMADRSLKLCAKIVPTLGHPTFRFNEQFLDERSVLPEKPAALLLTGHHAQSPAVLDHSRTLPQGDGRAGPAFTRRAIGGERNLVVLDAGDVFDDAFAVRCPRVDAESEGSFFF